MTNPEDELRAKVRALVQDERWGDAIAMMEEQTATVARSFYLAWTLGWALFKSNRPDDAIEYLTTATELEPANHVGYWALGEAHGASGNTADAERCLAVSLALKDSYQARRALGFLHHREGRIEQAEAIYREGVRLAPDHRERLETLADFLSDVGRKTEAESWYARARELPTRQERKMAAKAQS